MKDSIEYFIANTNNVLIRSFGNDPVAAQEWLDKCMPADKCTNLRIVSKTTTYHEIPRHE